MILALCSSTFLQYWNTYFESLSSPSAYTSSQNMNGYVPSCSFTFFILMFLTRQNVSSASFITTFSSVRFSISRNSFGAFITVSRIVMSLEYHIAEREPGSNRQLVITLPSTCHHGYLPTKRQLSASMFLQHFIPDSPSVMVTFSNRVSFMPNRGLSPPSSLSFISSMSLLSFNGFILQNYKYYAKRYVDRLRFLIPLSMFRAF